MKAPGERTVTLRLHVPWDAESSQRLYEACRITAWGRVATEGFEADVDNVRLDGDVTSGLLGFDAEWSQVLAGALISQSKGEGSYAQREGDDRGTVESTLAGVYPYARLELTERMSTWALAGFGTGELTLRQAGQVPIETGLGMRMGAVGATGTLLDGSGASGVGVKLKSDAMWVRTESDATTGLNGATGDVSCLRLGLAADRTFETGTGGNTHPERGRASPRRRRCRDGHRGRGRRSAALRGRRAGHRRGGSHPARP